MKIIDITGRVFHRLKVISRNTKRVGRTCWDCICVCGNTTVSEGYDLRSGNSKSCGCLTAERAVETNLIDVTGLVFGRLTALERVEQKKGSKSLWRCICICGVESLVRVDKLISTHTTSCGCARLDQPKLSTPHKRLENIASTAKRRARVMGATGNFTEAQVEALYAKQRGKCAGPFCGVNLRHIFHRDHKVALSKGGTNDISNIELLCERCNLCKQAKDPIEWANKNGLLL